MQAGRHLNLPIPSVVEGKEQRSYLQVSMEKSFLANGRAVFKLDKEALRSVILSAASGGKDCGVDGQRPQQSSFEMAKHNGGSQEQEPFAIRANSQGVFQLESDYAGSHFTALVTKQKEGTAGSSETKKLDNASECSHKCCYTVVQLKQGREEDEAALVPTRADLFQMCLNLVKKIQNINCEDKFYCLQNQQNSATQAQTQADKLKFEAATMNICPLDFSRVLIKISTQNHHSQQEQQEEQSQTVQIGFTALMPNTNFKIRAIPQMKLVSTPLSRLLLGKIPKEERSRITTLPSSGFITLDSEERVIPLMPQDPFLQETPAVGIWLWNVEDLRSPYVWSVCTRFVFCRNFRPQSGKMPTQQANQFLLVNFKKNHQAQFLMMQVDTSGQWVLFSDQKTVELSTTSSQEDEPIAFSGLNLQQMVTVADFLEASTQSNLEGSQKQSDLFRQQRKLAAAQNQTDQRSVRAASGGASLTAEYNSRYSRNQEEKKIALRQQPNNKHLNSTDVPKKKQPPLPPNNQTVASDQPTQLQQLQQDPQPLQQTKARTDLKITVSAEDQKQKESILRSNLRSNTPVSANTTRSRNSLSQNRGKAQQQQAAQPPQQHPQNPSTQNSQNANQRPQQSDVLIYKHNGVEREANASPRTKQAMAGYQAEILRLDQEVRALRATLLQQATLSNGAAVGDTINQSVVEVECELPNQETAQFAAPTSSMQHQSREESSYEQRLNLGQLETIKPFYNMHGYSSQPAQIASSRAYNNAGQHSESAQNPALYSIPEPASIEAAFFSHKVGQNSASRGDPESDCLALIHHQAAGRLHHKTNKPSSLSPKDLQGNPQTSNNRSRNLRKQTRQAQGVSALENQAQNVPRSPPAVGDHPDSNQLHQNPVLYKSCSEETLTSQAKAARMRQQQSNEQQQLEACYVDESSTLLIDPQQSSPSPQLFQQPGVISHNNFNTAKIQKGEEQKLDDPAIIQHYQAQGRRNRHENQRNTLSQTHGHPVSGPVPQMLVTHVTNMINAKQQSRNTNLVNIADNLEDQLLMPSGLGLHKRSSSSSHLGGGGGTGSGGNEGTHQTAEELAEMMNRAGGGRKASRNVLNDVNRKGEQKEEMLDKVKFDVGYDSRHHVKGGGAIKESVISPKQHQQLNPLQQHQQQRQPPGGESQSFDRMLAAHTRNILPQKHPIIEQQENEASPNDHHHHQADNYLGAAADSSSVNNKANFDTTNGLAVFNHRNRDGGGDKAAGERSDHHRSEEEEDEETNSEDGDHTYNPYSFKRLQDAIFKKEAPAVATQGNGVAANVVVVSNSEQPNNSKKQKDSAFLLPLQQQQQQHPQGTHGATSTTVARFGFNGRDDEKSDEHLVDMPLQMQTSKPLMFRGVFEQSPYLNTARAGQQQPTQENSTSSPKSIVNFHTMDSKLTFQQKQMQSHQRMMFHQHSSEQAPENTSPSQQFKEHDKKAGLNTLGGLGGFAGDSEQQASLPSESEQGSSYNAAMVPITGGHAAGDQNQSNHQLFIAKQTSQDIMANNFSQDFGVQSASQDSSLQDVFGTHGTFRKDEKMPAKTTFDSIASIQNINKKSDWTMDMPKIEYQPEQDDEDEDDIQSQGD